MVCGSYARQSASGTSVAVIPVEVPDFVARGDPRAHSTSHLAKKIGHERNGRVAPRLFCARQTWRKVKTARFVPRGPPHTRVASREERSQRRLVQTSGDGNLKDFRN